MKTRSSTTNHLVLSPSHLFLYAQAFYFSSGRGRCFSPGFKALCYWQYARLTIWLRTALAVKWWRYRLNRH